MRHLRIAFPYLLFGAMAAGVCWSNLRAAPPADVTAPPAERPATTAGQPAAADAPRCADCGMTLEPDGGVAETIDGVLRRFCCDHCRQRYRQRLAAGAAGDSCCDKSPERPGAAAPSGHADGRLIDPVCKMDVNAAWGIQYRYEGRTFYFCTRRCREQFAADPAAFLTQRCMVCNLPLSAAGALPATYLGKTYYLCSEEHRRQFKADPASFFMHRMWGIPDWLYYVSIALVLLVSFMMFEGVGVLRRQMPLARRRAAARSASAVALPGPPAATAPASGAAPRPSDRIDLLRLGFVKRLLCSRVFRFATQALMVALFVLIIAAGLFGNQNPGVNIAPLLTWTVWWGGLVVLIMFAGKAWCYMCPWDALAGWAEKLSLWKKKDQGLGLNLPWPRVARNIWLATILFVGLTWIELGFGVTMKPVVTAYLALLMLALAFVSAFLFERKSFCRYGCLVGRISGLYAMFSGVEIRRRRDDVCRACRSKECVRGSRSAYGCPTFEYPGKMQSNTYCIQCCECLQACPHDNLAVNLRPWGEDLKIARRPRRDEAYLALLMLSLTGFHGLTMTPVWAQAIAAIERALPGGRMIAFSVGMAALTVLPIVVYAALAWLSFALSGGGRNTLPADAGGVAGRPLTYGDYFIRYAYCVLPIALFYHLAHNLEHLLMEGQKVLALISDPFGWGWNLFGTAGRVVPPLVSLDTLWVLQVVLVGVGHVYSLWAANRITRRLFSDRRAATRGQWPMLAGMIAFSVLSLWLLKQPMEMRTSAM